MHTCMSVCACMAYILAWAHVNVVRKRKHSEAELTANVLKKYPNMGKVTKKPLLY